MGPDACSEYYSGSCEWNSPISHPPSVRHLVKVLQLFISIRFEKKSIHFPSRIEEELETACYSQEQVEMILAAAEGQYTILFATAAGTGLRAGELYGLQVEDNDVSRNEIQVRRSAWEGECRYRAFWHCLPPTKNQCVLNMCYPRRS
jgi:hypothetical protein